MIDIHTHILPGVDDGAQDMEESIELAELALEGGVDTIVATPHSNQRGRFENYAGPELDEAFQVLQDRLRKEGLPLRILPGMEIYASYDIREKITEGQLFGLNHSRYYLVEFPFDCEQSLIGECLEEIFDCGKIPLIAHPERYFCVQEYPMFLYEWLRMGCLSQVNRGSLFGRFGRHAQRAATILLEHRLVSCVASDAHSPYMRTTFMGDAWEYLSDTYGEASAYQLLEKNPGIILQDGSLPFRGMPPEQRRRFFW